MKYLLIAIFTLSINLLSAHDVELRFTQNRIEGDLLFVNIDMRGSTYDFNLASHNVRAFYNHAGLELIDIASQLPVASYSEPRVIESFTDGMEVNTGVLPFEDHMGFINMSVTLTDLVHGGIQITTDWTTIHTATFRIKSSTQVAQIVWAMENVTDVYATAFVEVGEWVAPYKIETKNVFDLRNFEQKIAVGENLSNDFTVTIGPNPTQSFVMIDQPSALAQLSIINMTGSIVKEMSLTAGQTKVDVSNYAAGSYIFFLQNGDHTSTKQILITE
jgi:hypothetical protein